MATWRAGDGTKAAFSDAAPSSSSSSSSPPPSSSSLSPRSKRPRMSEEGEASKGDSEFELPIPVRLLISTEFAEKLITDHRKTLDLAASTGASLQVVRSIYDGFNVVNITGKQSHREESLRYLVDLIHNETSPTKSTVSIKGLIPNFLVGRVIGKNGAVIRKISAETGGYVKLQRDKPHNSNTPERPIYIDGEPRVVIAVFHSVYINLTEFYNSYGQKESFERLRPVYNPPKEDILFRHGSERTDSETFVHPMMSREEQVWIRLNAKLLPRLKRSDSSLYRSLERAVNSFQLKEMDQGYFLEIRGPAAQQWVAQQLIYEQLQNCADGNVEHNLRAHELYMQIEIQPNPKELRIVFGSNAQLNEITKLSGVGLKMIRSSSSSSIQMEGPFLGLQIAQQLVRDFSAAAMNMGSL